MLVPLSVPSITHPPAHPSHPDSETQITHGSRKVETRNPALEPRLAPEPYALDFTRTFGVLCSVRRHRVQIFTRFRTPFIGSVSFWMFGKNRVFVRRLEWLTLFPATPILLQSSHFTALT